MQRADDAVVTASDLRRGGGVALWRQIAERIEQEAQAVRSDDTRLPTEAALAVRFGVNRHTVRRAIAELAKTGLVIAERGRGTFVDRAKLSYPIAARTRFGEAAMRAGREASGQLVSATAQTADAKVAGHLALAPGAPVLRLITRRRADGIAIAASQSWFPLSRFKDLGTHYARTGSITQALAACGVGDYRRRDTWITARLARRPEARTLSIEVGAAVLAMESINVDDGGAPIQFARTVFVAERVEFYVKS